MGIFEDALNEMNSEEDVWSEASRQLRSGWKSKLGEYALDLSQPNGAIEAVGTGLAASATTELPRTLAGAGQALTRVSLPPLPGNIELEPETIDLLKKHHPIAAFPFMVEQKIKEFKQGAFDIGESIKKWADEKEKQWFGGRTEEYGPVRKTIYEGAKMAAPSLIPAVTVGPIGTAMLFAANQYEQTVENAEDRAKQLRAEGRNEEADKIIGLALGPAGLTTAGIEGAGEYFGTKGLTKLFGLSEGVIAKRGAKQVITDFFKSLGIEVSTEAGQQAGEAAVEKYTAIRPEAQPLAEALNVVGPTVVLTGLTGIGGATYGAARGDITSRGLLEPEDLKAIDRELSIKANIGNATTPDEAIQAFENNVELGKRAFPIEPITQENIQEITEPITQPNFNKSAMESAKVFESYPSQSPAADSAAVFEDKERQRIEKIRQAAEIEPDIQKFQRRSGKRLASSNVPIIRPDTFAGEMVKKASDLAQELDDRKKAIQKGILRSDKYEKSRELEVREAIKKALAAVEEYEGGQGLSPGETFKHEKGPERAQPGVAPGSTTEEESIKPAVVTPEAIDFGRRKSDRRVLSRPVEVEQRKTERRSKTPLRAATTDEMSLLDELERELVGVRMKEEPNATGIQEGEKPPGREVSEGRAEPKGSVKEGEEAGGDQLLVPPSQAGQRGGLDKTEGKTQTHDYSSTQINIPEKEAGEIKAYANNIPENEIYTDPNDDSYGREDNPHITVRYGMETVDPKEIAPVFEGLGPIKAKMGKVSIFETDDYDVVKVDIESEDLKAANKKVGDTVDLPGETFKDYLPHATIAYVKNGEGKKYVGDKAFEGKEITVDSIVLSAKDGKMHEIKLAGKPEPKPKETKQEKVSRETPEKQTAKKVDKTEKQERKGETTAKLADLQTASKLVLSAIERSGFPVDKLRVKLQPIIKAKADQKGATLGVTDTNDIESVITIALAQDLMAMERTAYHELFHMAARWLLTDAQYKTLMKMYKGNEEDAAEGYAVYQTDGTEPSSKLVKRIYAKLKTFFTKLRNLLRGAGFQTAEDIFGNLEIGEVRETPRGVGLQASKNENVLAPVWVSKLEQVLHEKLPGAGTPGQIKQAVNSWANKGLFKAEELDHSGLIEWLDDQKGKITKQQVLDYLAENNVKIEEVVKGERKRWSPEQKRLLEAYKGERYEVERKRDYGGQISQHKANILLKEIDERYKNEYGFSEEDLVSSYNIYADGYQPDDTKFSQWQMEGEKENYREVLLTLPTKTVPINEDAINNELLGYQDELRKKYGRDLSYEELYGTASAAEKQELDRLNKLLETGMEQTKKGDIYKSPHFDEPNIVVHVRMNDRTGPNGEKILFLEEIQSDWAASNRKAISEITKPQGVGELGKDIFGAKLSSVMPIEAGDGGVLAILKHDQVRRAVISGVPIDVVDLLDGFETTLDDILNNNAVFSKPISDKTRRRIGLAVLNSAREVGASLRTKLLSSFDSGRGDINLLPTLKTSDLSTREVVGLLSPDSIYHGGLPGSTLAGKVAGAGAEVVDRSTNGAGRTGESNAAVLANSESGGPIADVGTKSLGGAAGPDGKGFSASLTNLINWHNKLLSKSGASQQASYISGPFVSTTKGYVGLALRRVVRYAAENGYDSIAWTPGRAQIDRYEEALQKEVDKIEWTKTDKGIQLVGYKNGSKVVDTVEKENAISDAIGKSMGDKIIESPDQSGTFEGDEITVSNTGMAGFYDRILPAEVNKFFNKASWGNAKVEKTNLSEEPNMWYQSEADVDGKEPPTLPGKEVWTIPITPEMRQKALYQGMTQFRIDGETIDDHIEKSTYASWDFLKKYAKNLLEGVETGRPDTTVLDRLLSVPMHYFNKVPSMWEIYKAGSRNKDNKEHLFNTLNIDQNGEDQNATIRNLEKTDKPGFKKLQEYLVSRDRDKIGYKLEQDGDIWVVKRPNGIALKSKFKSEQEALNFALQKEAHNAKKNGWTDEQVKALIAFRTITNNGFNLLMQPMRDLIAKAEAQGEPIRKIKVKSSTGTKEINLKKALAEMGDARGYYFPRIRKPGKYSLWAKKEGANPELHHFDSRTAMMFKKTRLEKKGYQVDVAPTRKMPEDVFEMVGQVAAFEAMMNEALSSKKGDVDHDITFQNFMLEALAEQVADLFKARGARSHMIRRSKKTGEEVYVGYEENPLIAITKYSRSLAGGEAKKNMALTMVRALTGTQETWGEYRERIEGAGDEADYEDWKKEVQTRRIDPIKQKNAYKDAKTYMEDMLRNQESIDRIIGTMKGIAVLKYLAGRVSAPVVNLTNMVAAVPATMNGYAGIPINKTFGHITNALRNYKTYKFGEKKNLDKWTKRAIDHIEDKGWHQAQYNKEALSVLQSKLGRAWSNITDLSMMGFGVTEQINRVGTILGAYKGIKAQHKGEWTSQNHMDALETAKTVSDKAHAEYGKANYPHLARGGNPAAKMAQVFYVFRTFSHNYLLTMKDLGFNQKNPKAALYMMFAPAILAGAGASVATPILSAIGQMLGADDPEESFYKWVGQEFGGTASNYARYGIVGLGGRGISLKGSLAINILDVPTSLNDLVGAPGSVISDIYEGGRNIIRGDISKGIEGILPLALSSPVKAYREYTEGLTTRNNTPIFYGKDQARATLTDALIRGLSFNPSRVAEIREKQWKESKIERNYSEIKTNIYARIKKFYLRPMHKRLKSEWVEIQNDIDAYNKGASKYPHMSKITPKTIKTMLKRAFRPSKKERMREAA
jgi:2'-5' RNA ligase